MKCGLVSSGSADSLSAGPLSAGSVDAADGLCGVIEICGFFFFVDADSISAFNSF